MKEAQSGEEVKYNCQDLRIYSFCYTKEGGRQTATEHSLLALCKTKENAALHPLNFLQKQ